MHIKKLVEVNDGPHEHLCGMVEQIIKMLLKGILIDPKYMCSFYPLAYKAILGG